ncbi:uncharacterized protein LOC134853393 [Symsagittifera roscoffensis]|uniref:uncharacterized protein LOC134853393 n=1 Tax=Symsagittifera roscoffensis TaxID=84072 RepID=UPI00307B4CA7
MAVRPLNGAFRDSTLIDTCTEPSTPVDLIATVPTHESVSFGWSTGGGTLTGYNVSINASNSTVEIEHPAIHNYTFVGLNPAADYTVTVTSYWVCPLDALTKTDPNGISLVVHTAPAAPILTVTNTNITLGGSTDSLYLQINQSSGDINNNLVTYSVFRYDNEGGLREIYSDLGPVSDREVNLWDTDLQPAQYYTYYAVAHYMGHDSEPSEQVGTCTYPGPVAHLDLHTHYTDYISLTWAAPLVGSNAPTYYAMIIDGNSSIVNYTEYEYNVTRGGTELRDRDVMSFTVMTVYSCPNNETYTGAATSISGYIGPFPPNITSAVPLSTTGIELHVIANLTYDQSENTTFLITRNEQYLSTVPAATHVIQDTLSLLPGYQYTYVANAIQRGLKSRMSAPFKTCTYPNLPTGLKVISQNSESVTLQFESPIEGRVDGFLFTIDGGFYSEHVTDTVQGTHTVTFPTTASTLSVNVRSYVFCEMTVNGGENTTLHSEDMLSITAHTTPLPPALELVPLGETSVQISFDVTDPAFTYHLWRDGVKIASDFSSPIIEDTGLIAGTGYMYKGAVEKNGVLSEVSDFATVHTLPPAVSELKMTAVTHDSLTVNWLNNMGEITGFCMYIDGVEDSCLTTAQLNMHTFEALNPNTAYELRVYTYILVNGIEINSSVTSIADRTTMAPPKITVAPGDMPGTMVIDFVDSQYPVTRTVYRLGPDGVWEQAYDVTDPFYDSQLQTAKEYTYKATYTGLNGAESASSDHVVMCTHPSKPVSLQMSKVDPTNGVYIAMWGQPNNPPTDYNVFIGDVETHSGVSGISQDISSSLSGHAKTYLVQVQSAYTCANADRGEGSTAASEELLSHSKTSLYVHIPPSQPTLVVSKFDSTTLQVDLSQGGDDANEEIVFFDVFRMKGASVEQGLRFMNVTDDEPLLDSFNLMPGTLYSYYTYAFYRGVRSGKSAVVSQCTDPQRPTGLRVVDSTSDDITLAWNPSANGAATDYEFEVDHGTPFFNSDFTPTPTLTLTLNISSTSVPTISSGTEFSVMVRSVFTCSVDGTNRISGWSRIEAATRPAKPEIQSVIPLVGSSAAIQVIVTVFDEFPDLTVLVFANGEQVGEMKDNLTFTHYGLLAGVQNEYTVAVVKHGLMSELSDPQWGCSFPGVPQFAYFTEQGENDVKISWTYPHDSAEQVGVSHYDVYRDDALVSPNQTDRHFSLSGLVPMTQMTLSIATDIICNVSNQSVEYSSISYEGGLKMVEAYTTPSQPEPYFFGENTVDQIQIGLDNPGANVWSVPYHGIRVFRYGVEVGQHFTSIDPFIFTDTGLEAASVYSYEVEVMWNGLTAYSAQPIETCTPPNIVQREEADNRNWYGVDFKWKQPLGNTVDSFEVKIDISGEDAWMDVGYVFDHSFRSPDTPDDFSISGTTGMLLAALDSKRHFTAKSIMPNTVYHIQIRSVYLCPVDNTIMYGDPVTVIAETAPYPPKDVQLEPRDTQSIQITWDGIQAPELVYDVMECSLDLTDCSTLVVANLTTDNYLITGLSTASMYCYEIVARWRGLETRTRDRYLWLDDYDYHTNETLVNDLNHVIDNAEFTEGHLTFDNYTHAYFDALCSCTYGPEPTAISWQQDTSSSLHFSWTVPPVSSHSSLSAPQTGQTLTMYTVVSHSEDNETQVELNFTHTLSHTFTSPTPAGLTFDPMTSKKVEVRTRLVCPDRKGQYYDSHATVLDSPSVMTTAWTRPTTPNITMTDQQLTNPDEEIRVDYNTPDVEYLFFQMYRNGTLLPLNDTTHYLIDTGLTPGTVYSYTVFSTYFDQSGTTLTSLLSPPEQQCTLPADVPSLNKTNLPNTNRVLFEWTAPVDNYIGYNYSTDEGVTFTTTSAQSVTLTNLDWCDPWHFTLYSLGNCGEHGDAVSEHAQEITGVVAPATPVILLNSRALSTSEIVIAWDDPNTAHNCDPETYTAIVRNGTVIYNSSDPSFPQTTDFGLAGATVYSYTAMSSRGGEPSPISDPVIICTEPDPVDASTLTCTATDTLRMDLSWQPPSGIQASGYDLDTTGRLVRNVKQLNTNSYELVVNYPGSEYRLNVTVAVLIDCPMSSGSATQRSTSNTLIPITCYTYPQEVTFSVVETTSTTTRLAWTQKGGSTYFNVTVTPHNRDGPLVDRIRTYTTTNQTIEIDSLDGGLQNNIVVVNYYQGYPSNPTEYIHNPLGPEEKLLGQTPTIGGAIIGIIALLGACIIAACVFAVYKIVKTLKAKPADNLPPKLDKAPRAW